MSDPQDKDQIIAMQQRRIDHLENSYQKLLDNITTLAQSREFSKDITSSVEPSAILDVGLSFIRRLIHFEEIAFYLIDDEDSSFVMTRCDPPNSKLRLEHDVDMFIEDGTFAWALRQNHPVIVPSKSIDLTFIFHVIATQTRTRGMFIGTVKPSSLLVTDPAITMLSITLQNISYAFENVVLYSRLNDRAESLEEEVAKRTAELLKEKQNADAANSAKSEFLASMSHELRTPLNGIIGLTELTLEMGLTKDQHEHMQMVTESARMLLHIINDILDFSKIEAGKFELENVEFDLKHVLHSVIDPLGVVADKKGLTIDLEVGYSVPMFLTGDSGRLRQMLFNLLGNAVKFTETGGCLMRVEHIDDGPNLSVGLRFSIKDTGVGIPKDKQELIFGKFSQADQSVTRRFGGTGLGLAISKSLAEMMGGRIWVESEPGHGSCFFFTVYFGRADGPPMLDASTHIASPLLHDAPSKTKLKILLAEDNKINQIVAKSFLQRDGHSVRIAENGLEVLSALSEENFDLIFMDVEMPMLDGIETTRRIRQNLEGKYSSTIPIIALTAHAMAGYSEKLFAAGMDYYLTKPISIKDLRSALMKTMSGRMALCELQPETSVKPRVVHDRVLDLEGTLQRLGHDRALFDQTRKVFESEAPSRYLTLQNALDLKQPQDARVAAHSFKNLALNIGAGKLSTLMASLEALCVSCELDSASALLQDVSRELEAVTMELQQKLGPLV